MKVLVVDDSKTMRDMISHLLGEISHQEFEVILAETGQEAVDLYTEHDPKVVLLDYLLPDINGIEVIKSLDENKKQLPVIMVTSFDDVQLAIDAMGIGAKGYILKDRLSVDSLWIGIKDMLDKIAVQEKLEFNQKELKRSNIELEQFANIVCHDLQAPLRNIAQFTGLIKKDYEEGMDEKMRGYFAHVENSSKNMQELIKDLFDYSKVSIEKAEFEEVDCNAALEKTLSNLHTDIEENNAKVTYDSLPKVKGRETQISELLQNLIANGLKYQREDQVKIHVGVEKKGKEWLFSVKDNGIGMKEHSLEMIFLPFKRLNNTGFSGSGIGLAVCKKIVEQHKGSIWVDSEEGVGSVFFFTLPAESFDN